MSKAKKTVITESRPEHLILGRLIRKSRQKKGLTQVELGQKLERGHAFISKVERGLQHLDLATLLDICYLVDADIVELVASVRDESPVSRYVESAQGKGPSK